MDWASSLISGGVTVYTKAAPFERPPRGTADYAGEFVSDEVGATLTIAPQDSALVIAKPGSWSFRAEPVFHDAFAIPDVLLVRFTHDRRGHIDGMMMHSYWH